jgi:hypothetical protein
MPQQQFADRGDHSQLPRSPERSVRVLELKSDSARHVKQRRLAERLDVSPIVL